MDIIEIDGKKYKLVPVEEAENLVEKYTSTQVVSENKSGQGDGKINEAVPKVSEYRERYKQRKVRLSDIQTQPNLNLEIPKQSSDLDKFTYQGEKLFFGEGVQREY